MTRKTATLAAAAAAAAVFSAPALAEPAPWYWWASKTTGQRTCAQSLPEQGWTRIEGPYRDARCTKPATRK